MHLRPGALLCEMKRCDMYGHRLAGSGAGAQNGEECLKGTGQTACMAWRRLLTWHRANCCLHGIGQTACMAWRRLLTWHRANCLHGMAQAAYMA
eukprot:365241-Chlamydomonas_euryale.AAC.12